MTSRRCFGCRALFDKNKGDNYFCHECDRRLVALGSRAWPPLIDRRLAGKILFCLIAALIVVAYVYCMWRATGGGK